MGQALRKQYDAIVCYHSGLTHSIQYWHMTIHNRHMVQTCDSIFSWVTYKFGSLLILFTLLPGTWQFSPSKLAITWGRWPRLQTTSRKRGRNSELETLPQGSVGRTYFFRTGSALWASQQCGNLLVKFINESCSLPSQNATAWSRNATAPTMAGCCYPKKTPSRWTNIEPSREGIRVNAQISSNSCRPQTTCGPLIFRAVRCFPNFGFGSNASIAAAWGMLWPQNCTMASPDHALQNGIKSSPI